MAREGAEGQRQAARHVQGRRYVARARARVERSASSLEAQWLAMAGLRWMAGWRVQAPSWTSTRSSPGLVGSRQSRSGTHKIVAISVYEVIVYLHLSLSRSCAASWLLLAASVVAVVACWGN